jgi:hypothetical protein
MQTFWVVEDPNTGNLTAFEDAGQAAYFAEMVSSEVIDVSPFTVADAEAYLDALDNTDNT